MYVTNGKQSMVSFLNLRLAREMAMTARELKTTSALKLSSYWNISVILVSLNAISTVPGAHEAYSKSFRSHCWLRRRSEASGGALSPFSTFYRGETGGRAIGRPARSLLAFWGDRQNLWVGRSEDCDRVTNDCDEKRKEAEPPESGLVRGTKERDRITRDWGRWGYKYLELVSKGTVERLGFSVVLPPELFGFLLRSQSEYPGHNISCVPLGNVC